MQPLTANDISGTWGTLLLPIDDGDAIDFVRLSDQLDALVAAGVDGVYCNGTAGELDTLSVDEFDRVAALLADRCERRGVPFQIGACWPIAREALDRVRRAVAYRPGAIQVVLPDWRPVNDEEAIDALRRYADAADGIGLVLYNPPHAKRVLDPVSLGAIARGVSALVGVKVAGGDVAWYEAMGRHVAGLSVFVPGHALATGIANGASGSYSNVACLSPEFAMRWQRMMHTDTDAAIALEGRIVAFIRDRIVPLRDRDGFGNAALDKLLACLGGWADVGPRLRWPYRGVGESVIAGLRPHAASLLTSITDDARQS